MKRQILWACLSLLILIAANLAVAYYLNALLGGTAVQAIGVDGMQTLTSE